MEIIYLITGLGVGAILGWLLGKVQNKPTPVSGAEAGLKALEQERNVLLAEYNDLDKRLSILQNDNERFREEIKRIRILNQEEQEKCRILTGQLSEWQTRHHHLNERLSEQRKEIEDLQEKFTAEFKNIANGILEEKSITFAKQNKDNLDQILAPLKERISDFESRIEKTYNEESKERISLKSEIKHLMDLNKQLSDDANNLASALKGESKTQGDWGELQLEMILEHAGLNRGIHFSMQSSFRDEEGTLKRPDFVIHLPENKQLIIDSKVSLTAYDRFFSAETEEEKALQLKAHLGSIRNHIRELSAKNYQNLYQMNTPDYVLMYIPVESAFTLAFRNDEKLFEFALNKNIVVVTTSTLLATMRTVSFIWKQDNQKKNVLEIARQGGDLYDKFVGFVNDLTDIGKRIDAAKKAYDGAINKLSTGKGSLVKRVENIRKLGLKTSKNIPDYLLEPAPDENIPHPNTVESITEHSSLSEPDESETLP